MKKQTKNLQRQEEGLTPSGLPWDAKEAMKVMRIAAKMRYEGPLLRLGRPLIQRLKTIRSRRGAYRHQISDELERADSKRLFEDMKKYHEQIMKKYDLEILETRISYRQREI